MSYSLPHSSPNYLIDFILFYYYYYLHYLFIIFFFALHGKELYESVKATCALQNALFLLNKFAYL